MGNIIVPSKLLVKPRFEWKPRHIHGHPLSIGLVGHWLFNEGAGLRAHDISGFENHGTLTNMNFSSTSGWNFGQFGCALSFDGTNDYVTTNDMSSVEGLYGLTVAVWCYPIAWDYNDFLIEKGNTFFIGSHNAIWNNVNGGFALREAGTTNWKKVLQIVTPTLNAWNHVVGVYNGSNILIYLNGIDNSYLGGDPYTGVTRNETDVFNIGGRSTDFPFNGLISDVRIYNRALPSIQILDLYRYPFADLEVPILKRRWFPGAAGISIPVAMHHYMNH